MGEPPVTLPETTIGAVTDEYIGAVFLVRPNEAHALSIIARAVAQVLFQLCCSSNRYRRERSCDGVRVECFEGP